MSPGRARRWLAGVFALLVAVGGCSSPARQLAGAAALVAPTAADEPAWRWQLPPGFPPPVVPADNPMTAAKVELGRRLFHDTRLSGNGRFACASCHRQELGFADGRPRAVGSTGQLHPRGAMSLTNVVYNATLNWADPRLRELEHQALVPMFNEAPVELGLAGREREILERFRADPDYVRMFRESFPADATPLTMSNLVRAIAAFERTLISGSSAYDRLVYGGETDALDPSARRGMRLFFSERLRCAECHAGFNFSGPVVFEGGTNIEPTFHNTGLYDVDGRGGYPPDNTGLHGATGHAEHMGQFRAPTLRNIAVTAPYMHDGSLATLEAVVDFYAAAGRVVADGSHAGDGRANPLKSERVAGFVLDAQERRDVVAFLESLTDPDFLSDPAIGAP